MSEAQKIWKTFLQKKIIKKIGYLKVFLQFEVKVSEVNFNLSRSN
jgi:hypothetical protein